MAPPFARDWNLRRISHGAFVSNGTIVRLERIADRIGLTLEPFPAADRQAVLDLVT
jgi:hypothetical protein